MDDTSEQGQANGRSSREAQEHASQDFDREWTKVQNWVFDVVMPCLSGSAFKVFCVVLRQTWGWKLPGAKDNRIRKQWDIISWSQFQRKAGIVGRDTLKRALHECLNGEFIKRMPAGQSYAYTIPAGLETIPIPRKDRQAYGNGTASSMEPIHTKAKESKGNQSAAGDAAVVVVPQERDAVFQALLRWGVRKRTARQLALECSYDYVTGWIRETERLVSQGQVYRNPIGFLVTMLSNGETLPARCVTCGNDPVPGRFCQGCGQPLCDAACAWYFKSEKGQGRFWCEPCIEVEDAVL